MCEFALNWVDSGRYSDQHRFRSPRLGRFHTKWSIRCQIWRTPCQDFGRNWQRLTGSPSWFGRLWPGFGKLCAVSTGTCPTSSNVARPNFLPNSVEVVLDSTACSQFMPSFGRCCRIWCPKSTTHGPTSSNFDKIAKTLAWHRQNIWPDVTDFRLELHKARRTLARNRRIWAPPREAAQQDHCLRTLVVSRLRYLLFHLCFRTKLVQFLRMQAGRSQPPTIRTKPCGEATSQRHGPSGHFGRMLVSSEWRAGTEQGPPVMGIFLRGPHLVAASVAFAKSGSVPKLSEARSRCSASGAMSEVRLVATSRQDRVSSESKA